MTAASAALRDAVAPRLQMLIQAGTPAGEVTRQAGLQAQVHFRSHGIALSPLELRGYVAAVLRPVLPATSFAASAPADEPVPFDDAAIDVPEPTAQPEPRVLLAPAPAPAPSTSGYCGSAPRCIAKKYATSNNAVTGKVIGLDLGPIRKSHLSMVTSRS